MTALPQPTSPALSAASTSSYDFVSPRQRSSTMSSVGSSIELPSPVDAEEDYIVWPQGSTVPPSGSESSDEDFVVLSIPRPHGAHPPASAHVPSETDSADTHLDRGLAINIPPLDDLNTSGENEALRTATMTPLPPSPSLQRTTAAALPPIITESTSAAPKVPPAAAAKPKSKKKKRSKGQGKKKDANGTTKATSATPAATAKPAPSAKLVKGKKKGKKSKASSGGEKNLGLGSRPIVDDLSGIPSPVEDNTSLFQEASTYISSYLSNPEAKTNMVCRLTLLQSLIIELGLETVASALPRSLKAARAVLKSRAFLNIKEYVMMRSQGPEAIRKLLYPSRSALAKALRKKRNGASLGWVKEHGLQVLLVGCFH